MIADNLYSISKHYVELDKKPEELKTRFVRCAVAPVFSLAWALDTLIGLGAGVASIFPLGEYRPSHKFVKEQLDASQRILVIPYFFFLKLLNPKVKDSDYTRLTKSLSDQHNNSDYLDDFLKSDQFLKRHVATRLSYSVLAVSISVVAAVQMVFAIPLAALSLLTVGKFEILNDSAEKCLLSVGVIQDLYEIARKIINPQIEL